MPSHHHDDPNLPLIVNYTLIVIENAMVVQSENSPIPLSFGAISYSSKTIIVKRFQIFANKHDSTFVTISQQTFFSHVSCPNRSPYEVSKKTSQLLLASLKASKLLLTREKKDK